MRPRVEARSGAPPGPEDNTAAPVVSKGGGAVSAFHQQRRGNTGLKLAATASAFAVFDAEQVIDIFDSCDAARAWLLRWCRHHERPHLSLPRPHARIGDDHALSRWWQSRGATSRSWLGIRRSAERETLASMTFRLRLDLRLITPALGGRFPQNCSDRSRPREGHFLVSI